jgi:hypothetical protein
MPVSYTPIGHTPIGYTSIGSTSIDYADAQIGLFQYTHDRLVTSMLTQIG